MDKTYTSEVAKYTAWAGLEFSAAFATGYLVARNANASFQDIVPHEPVTQCVYDFATNNLTVGALGIALPLWIAGINGYEGGYNYYILSRKWGHQKVIKAVAPHAIIEIPTIIAFCGIGIKLKMDIWHALTGHSVDWEATIINSLELSFYLSILMIMAAFIEIYFSQEQKLWEGKVQLTQGCLLHG